MRDALRCTKDQHRSCSGPPDVRIEGGFIMQDTCPTGTPRAASRSRPPSGGYVTLGTLILAAASALFLVAMSGCHSAPAANAFSGTTADKAVEQQLRRSGAMAPIQPFDEGFVAVSDTDAP
jgi:hypothetical protein